MTDVGILSLPSGSGALPISTIAGRGPSLRRVLGLDREGAPPRAATLGWNALDLAGPEASADLAPKVPTSVIYSKDHSRPDQRDHHPAPEQMTMYVYRPIPPRARGADAGHLWQRRGAVWRVSRSSVA